MSRPPDPFALFGEPEPEPRPAQRPRPVDALEALTFEAARDNRAAWRYYAHHNLRLADIDRTVALYLDDHDGHVDETTMCDDLGLTPDRLWRAVDRLADAGMVKLHADGFVFLMWHNKRVTRGAASIAQARGDQLPTVMNTPETFHASTTA